MAKFQPPSVLIMSTVVSPQGPKPGWIYCLANPASPGLVKIGCTSQTVDQRMAELDTTGVAMPFCLLGKWLSPDIRRDEKAVHLMLSSARTRQAREWFEVGHEEIVGLICEIGQYMQHTNGAHYNPPVSATELEQSDWLADMGITSQKQGGSFGGAQARRPRHSSNSGVSPQIMGFVLAIVVGSVFVSANILTA